MASCQENRATRGINGVLRTGRKGVNPFGFGLCLAYSVDLEELFKGPGAPHAEEREREGGEELSRCGERKWV